MSANYVVDLFNATLQGISVGQNMSGALANSPASGIVIGLSVDFLYANAATQLVVVGGPSVSGQCRIAVQTSDTDVSGNYTDPTSGLQTFPGAFLSGGIYVYNSGNVLASGGIAGTYFQRPNRFVRAIVLSGDQFNAPVQAGFLGQAKLTGSGYSYTWSPGSGTQIIV
jgi:hypothetical protein